VFCPSCRAEFREGFSPCESCDADLVEEKDLPPELAQATEEPDPEPEDEIDETKETRPERGKPFTAPTAEPR